MGKSSSFTGSYHCQPGPRDSGRCTLPRPRQNRRLGNCQLKPHEEKQKRQQGQRRTRATSNGQGHGVIWDIMRCLLAASWAQVYTISITLRIVSLQFTSEQDRDIPGICAVTISNWIDECPERTLLKSRSPPAFSRSVSDGLQGPCSWTAGSAGSWFAPEMAVHIRCQGWHTTSRLGQTFSDHNRG